MSYMKRSTHATEVVFEPKAHGEFTVVIRWVNKDQTTGEYKKDFTKEFVFGSTFRLSPQAWVVEKRACDYARDIVRGVLQQRGVL